MPQVADDAASTRSQDTQDDPAMERFLVKKTLRDKITHETVNAAKMTYLSPECTSKEIHQHIAERVQILWEYLQYNTKKEKAEEAYKEMEEWYTTGKYDRTHRDTAKKRCRKLGFPFAQKPEAPPQPTLSQPPEINTQRKITLIASSSTDQQSTSAPEVATHPQVVQGESCLSTRYSG